MDEVPLGPTSLGLLGKGGVLVNRVGRLHPDVGVPVGRVALRDLDGLLAVSVPPGRRDNYGHPLEVGLIVQGSVQNQ